MNEEDKYLEPTYNYKYASNEPILATVSRTETLYHKYRTQERFVYRCTLKDTERKRHVLWATRLKSQLNKMAAAVRIVLGWYFEQRSRS